MTHDARPGAGGGSALPHCTPPSGAFEAVRGVVRHDGRVVLACWHAETDTLPRVVPHRPGGDGEPDPDLVDLVLPVGVFSAWGEAARVEVELRTDPPEQGGPRRHSSEDGGGVEVLNRSMMAREVYRGSRQRSDPAVLDRRRHSVDLDRAVFDAGHDKTFHRLTVRGLPRDGLVRYAVRATTPMVRGAAAESAFALRASLPAFSGRDDIRAVRVPDGGQGDPELRHWTLLHNRERGIDHIRVDFLSTILPHREAARPPVRVTVGDAVFDLGADRNVAAAGEPVPVPVLDRQLDSVLVSVPVPPDGALPAVTVQVPGEPAVPVDLAADPPEPVWLMIVNYCIQGLNDLFAVPVDRYDPPRTYMGVTMRDEYGTWSSRPGSGEDADPDGYALTFEGHRYFGVPSMWAFNAPVLTMIAHDCPDEYAEIRRDVAERGVVVPVNAGFGAHRTPYYSATANLEEIRRGHEVIGALLPRSPADGLAVYYPDQRLYGGTPQEHEVFAAHPDLVKYLVLDRSTLCHEQDDPSGVQRRFFPDAAPEFRGNRLLLDPRTGATMLPIEDAVRETMVGGNDDEADRGKAARGLREVLLQGLARNAAEHRHGSSPVLLVYADDADKASGNGWFDGDYSGRPVHFNDKYQATLCWLRDHPWVRVVTVAEADVAAARPVRLHAPLASATCPSVDPAGATERDLYGNLLHFDTWERQWAATRSPWLGATLGELSRDVEDTLVNWPKIGSGLGIEPDRGMVDLAWMTFLGLHHEMMWNKEPLEGGFVNRRCGVISPEDFVVAASLHLRTAHVYLAAAAWAGWARTATGDDIFLNAGPLLDLLTAGGLGGEEGLHWDRDLLPTDVLYNGEVLAVLDRNGGRVTHLFACDRRTGRAACVSGTPKVHQWTGPVPGRAPHDWLTCDGGVLENSVLTPNHLYVGSDLEQARARVGLRHEDRPRQPSPREWLYPDTFNEYVAEIDRVVPSVRFTYGPAVGLQPTGPIDDAVFAQACELDRAGKLAPTAGAASGVVWHDGPSFSKTFRLQGRRLEVRYEDAPRGHLVGNEFCLDVHAAMTRGEFHRRDPDPDAAAFRLTGPGGLHVTLTPGVGCRLTPTALAPDLHAATGSGIAEDWLRLHRVMTDAVEVLSPDGGSFGYTVDIGFADAGSEP